MAEQKKTVDLTTGIVTLSFPRVFPSTAGKDDNGATVYDTQILIPKSDKAQAKAILAAIKEVGEGKWGDNWKQVKHPLRDADKEKDQLTEDGQKKGDKYPERLGHWFMNCRSKRPIAVVDRGRSPITETDKVYAGVQAKVAINFYTYATKGNSGIAAGLNGIQIIADGEPIGGGGKPPVESMFDMLEDDGLGIDDDLGLDGLDDDEPKAKKDKKKSKK